MAFYEADTPWDYYVVTDSAIAISIVRWHFRTFFIVKSPMVKKGVLDRVAEFVHVQNQQCSL